jgi:hypothetical protein
LQRAAPGGTLRLEGPHAVIERGDLLRLDWGTKAGPPPALKGVLTRGIIY